MYYCFGCQASGDVFTFVQETEGVDFKGALELLADRAGIELQLEQEDPREAERRGKRERLLELLSRTTAYYERYLWESEEAAGARELPRGAWPGGGDPKEFRVGYAPSAWDRVLLASRRGGFSERELYETGLAQRSQETRGAIRPLSLAHHVPTRRHAWAGARVRRAGDARGAEAEVPEHLRQRRLPQGTSPLWSGPGASRGGKGRAR